MGRDRVSQIKAVFNYRKKAIKDKKKIKGLVALLAIAVVTTYGIYVYAQSTVDVYYAKSENLNYEFMELENQKTELESQKTEVENQKQELKEEQERILSEAELVAQNNEKLIKENINLQNTILKAAATGITPQNYEIPDEVDNPVDYSKLKYIGKFEGTAYTPSPDECSNNLGYTASGKAIVPGVSIAVDTDYWKLGTKFYIEGLGYVVAMDTGSAVKGKYRFDYAVFDKEFAFKLGRQNWKVYLVLED